MHFIVFSASSVRLSYLQEIMNDFYGNELNAQKMKFPEEAFLIPDLPCVIFDKITQKFFRGKITRFSGDRSILDVLAVDYPSLLFKEISINDIFMLSDRFFLPPQCVSIQLVQSDDEIRTHHFTKMAKSLVEIGSVAAVSLPPKTTIASLRCLDDIDLLEKIGYFKKTGDDNDVIRNLNDFVFPSNASSVSKSSFTTPNRGCQSTCGNKPNNFLVSFFHILQNDNFFNF